MNTIRLAVCSTLALSGCGRYGDFTLPAASGRQEAAGYRVEVDPAPVLARGAPGEWDSVDVLNPSVVKREGTYFNFYSGYDGRTWHTGLATSADGVRWARRGRVLSPLPGTWEGDYIAANGAAAVKGGEFLYWYQAGRLPRIGLARSTDGMRWTRHARPVLGTGPRGSWDERGVADPYVIEAGGRFYLYYLGEDRARRQRLGVAVSADGLHWKKLRANPILELGGTGTFDENGLGEPAVWHSRGGYWMLYTGRDRAEVRRLGLARSQDGVRWKRISDSPVLAGGSSWNSKVVCDPTVEAGANGLRFWFGGGDVAHPAENIHGQIGAGRLIPVK